MSNERRKNFTGYCRKRIIGKLEGVGEPESWQFVLGAAMPNFLQTTAAQLILWLAICAVLLTVGIYVVAKVRQSLSEREAATHDLMTNFRELHSRGELSDDEYRTIKATLAARLQREVKDKGEEG